MAKSHSRTDFASALQHWQEWTSFFFFAWSSPDLREKIGSSAREDLFFFFIFWSSPDYRENNSALQSEKIYFLRK